MSRIAVVVFPGSNCEHDVMRSLNSLGGSAELVWHTETELEGVSGIVLPGGFAHGDYLRTGAIARFSPVMEAVSSAAASGVPVLGICNGFQVLCEAGLLPGALVANRDLRFICRMIEVEVVSTRSVLTAASKPGDVISIPLNSYEGNFISEPIADTDPHVALRYHGDNPNGSQDGIAGIANQVGNVVGLMPHPERSMRLDDGGAALLESFVASSEMVPA